MHDIVKTDTPKPSLKAQIDALILNDKRGRGRYFLVFAEISTTAPFYTGPVLNCKTLFRSVAWVVAAVGRNLPVILMAESGHRAGVAEPVAVIQHGA